MIQPRGVRGAVELWVQEALTSVTPSNPVNIHADVLARELRAGNDHLELIWQAYVEVVSIISPNARQYMPVLAVDLEPSDALDVHLPGASDLESQLSSEPPSIYLIDRQGDMLLKNFERYRCPLEALPPPLNHRLDGVYFFYECSRSEQARRLGWEYNRRIYAEYFPVDLVAEQELHLPVADD